MEFYELSENYRTNERGEIVSVESGRHVGGSDALFPAELQLMKFDIQCCMEMELVNRLHFRRVVIPPEEFRGRDKAGADVFVKKGRVDHTVYFIGNDEDSRPGVWSFDGCISTSFGEGTMLEDIQIATTKGYGIVIMNQNDTMRLSNGIFEKADITPEDHVLYTLQKTHLPLDSFSLDKPTISFLCYGFSAAEHILTLLNFGMMAT
eukprot:TRINITY_DN2609_c0_g1_i3.p1 TRINITY_DN2609_c0_g1~~TRINITY_DN2609_c0_g1_i3.p1  ORF type:complete len:206 (+),score=35.74 TRINITY_DN2609_c0_g1_i3:108-725(+)